jgi:2-polyprenyl-6-methoxyphenol hydroxylase-like FAD-dependent oxidoreductase
MNTHDAHVLVVGAGPTGLLLAGDLAAAGVAVTVLERRSDESPWTRAWAGTDVGAAMAAWPSARPQRQPSRVGR